MFENISIRALRGEGDAEIARLKEELEGISIRALRGEGDLPKSRRLHLPIHFNPRPPRGGRL